MAVVALLLTATTGCASGATSSRAPAGSPVWLCDPQHPAGDPCLASSAATSVPATGPLTPASPPAPGDPARYACFYVYPTVSREPTDNADLRVQEPELNAARTQVAPFSSDCSVWAPMYEQVTVDGLPAAFNGASSVDVAYRSVLASFEFWLAHDAGDLPIIFIGHSQGSAMLIRLLHQEVDPDPALRARVVSAILLGGNVTVATGKTVGGSFDHLPLCATRAQVGCVVAYSSFPSRPPKTSLFGYPGKGVSRLADTTAQHGLQVACTNPPALVGAGTRLDPLFPPSPPEVIAEHITTPFVTYPGLYTSSCRSVGGATWLQVDTSTSPTDHRPRVRVRENLGPTWGYHVDDVSLALGDLVDLVAAQEAVWSARTQP